MWQDDAVPCAGICRKTALDVIARSNDREKYESVKLSLSQRFVKPGLAQFDRDRVLRP